MGSKIVQHRVSLDRDSSALKSGEGLSREVSNLVHSVKTECIEYSL